MYVVCGAEPSSFSNSLMTATQGLRFMSTNDRTGRRLPFKWIFVKWGLWVLLVLLLLLLHVLVLLLVLILLPKSSYTALLNSFVPLFFHLWNHLP